jgi:hypothetical protein
MSEIYEITPNLNENSPRIEQPDKITIPLKEHQKAIIYHARKLEKMIPINIGNNKQMITQFGIICDHVGAGKSYEVLGTIASCPSLNQKLNFQLFNKDNPYTIYSYLTKIDTNIIVTPHSIFKQWEDYIIKSTTLKYYSINNFKALKNLLDGYIIDELYEESDPIDEPLILNLLSDKRSFEELQQNTFQPQTPHKITSRLKTKTKTTSQIKHTTDSKVRDTKYYRYLEPYFQNHPDIEKIMNQYGKLNISKLHGYDIVLISASLYNELAFYMIKDNYYCNRLFFDEADSINIPNNLKIYSIFYWFVTSSSTSLCNPEGITKQVNLDVNISNPRNYLNREKYIIEKSIKCNGFIKDTFRMCKGDPDRMNYYLKNDDKFIEMSFKLPEIIEHLIISRDNVQFKILDGIVSNDVIMMLNAGDTEGAINHLSCEKGSEDNIISVVTQRLEKKIDEYKDELKEKKIKEYSTPKSKEEALERTQDKIKETRRKIELIKERIKNVDCCDICFEDINNPAVTSCCQNVFCFSCLALSISGKNICPKCRGSLTLDKIMLIQHKKEGENESNTKPVIKIVNMETTLQDILDNAINTDKYTNLENILAYKTQYFPKEKRKMLIFSEYEGTFNEKMDTILKKYNIKYSRIKGTSASINKTLREYRGHDLKPGDHEVDVLLINSRFFGAGLNLQNSSDIIILHRQGDDLLHQIIGRAQRIGRKDSLNVWKLYNNNEAYQTIQN